MAEFVCPSCDHRQSVPDAHIGKTAKCPKCQEPSVVQDVATNNVQDDPVNVEPTSSTIVLRESGGSIQTVLSHMSRLNKESTLEREFITIINKELPVGLTRCVGITTVYERGTDYSASRYIYATKFAVKALEDVRAFETRFLLFNIWGRHVQSLTATEIADVRAGAVRQCEGKWDLFDENEASEHYASIAYIATIRTYAGQVYEADIDPVLAEAKRFSSKFTDTDLEPTPLKR